MRYKFKIIILNPLTAIAMQGQGVGQEIKKNEVSKYFNYLTPSEPIIGAICIKKKIVYRIVKININLYN